jgi:hypothetical protein
MASSTTPRGRFQRRTRVIAVRACHNLDVPPLRTVHVTRYVTPLREGGSLPAIVEADDEGLYVLKFRGAGQGPRALIAELVAGEIGRALGLSVPELVLADVDPELARTEPDPEIHALILDSAGLNLAMDYLPGSVTYDPLIHAPDDDLASQIVWFDAYVMNVDRTARNTNILLWHRRLWLIDHGAALYFHHTPDWETGAARARDPFPRIAQHVLMKYARSLHAIDASMVGKLDVDVVRSIVESIPASWIQSGGVDIDVARERTGYLRFLLDRLQNPRPFLTEALRGR